MIRLLRERGEDYRLVAVLEGRSLQADLGVCHDWDGLHLFGCGHMVARQLRNEKVAEPAGFEGTPSALASCLVDLHRPGNGSRFGRP